MPPGWVDNHPRGSRVDQAAAMSAPCCCISLARDLWAARRATRRPLAYVT